jgi:hypothetical protein
MSPDCKTDLICSRGPLAVAISLLLVDALPVRIFREFPAVRSSRGAQAATNATLRRTSVRVRWTPQTSAGWTLAT